MSVGITDRGQSLRWTLADAIRRTKAFEEHGLTWIEEPLEPSDLQGFQTLRQHCQTLIATGEREWEPSGFKALIESGIVDVVGCDVGRAQGITGCLKVIEYIEAPRAALAEVARVLIPGGRAVIAVPELAKTRGLRRDRYRQRPLG